MKIALTQNIATVSGVPVYVSQLVRGLKEHGAEVWVVTPTGDMVEKYRADGANVIERMPQRDIDWQYISWLRDWLKEQEIDVLHTNMLKATVNGMIAGRLANTPVRVAHIHGTLIDWEVPWYKKLPNVVINSLVTNMCATDVVALTPSIGRQLVRQEYILKSKIRILPNGIELGPRSNSDRSYWRRRLKLSHHEPIIGSFSRLTVEKSVETLILAAPRLMAEIPTIQVIIAGEGDRRNDLQRLAQDCGVAERIHFVGFVPEADKRQALAGLDAYVFPSRREGFGITLLEAMRSETLVVSSDLPVLQDIVTNGQTGLLFKTGDSQDLADTVLRALRMSSKERLMMTGRAYDMLEQQYSVEKFVDRYWQMYEASLKSR